MDTNALVLSKNKVALREELENKLLELEEQKTLIENQYKEIKDLLLHEMANNDITSVKTERLLVTYQKPYQKEDFNKKKFREEHPDIYDEYVSFSTVNGCIKIKVK